MNKFLFPILLLASLAMALTSCDDSKSYAELLTDENQAVNKYLVEFRVIDHIPADSVFEIGENAPYYCIDENSNVYMQVLSAGTDERPQKNDRVYFRFMRYSLFDYVIGGDNTMIGAGNAEDMNTQSTYFLYDNLYATESYKFGEGIQLPMRFLGYNAKVNLIIKSQAGPESDMAYVVPYLYNITYYKSMI